MACPRIQQISIALPLPGGVFAVKLELGVAESNKEQGEVRFDAGGICFREGNSSPMVS